MSMGQDSRETEVRDKEVLKCGEEMCVSEGSPDPRSKGRSAASPLFPFLLTLPSCAPVLDTAGGVGVPLVWLLIRMDYRRL